MSKTIKITLTIVGTIIALAVADMLFFVTPLDKSDVDTIARHVDGADTVNWKWLDGPRNWWGERHGLCASYRAISNTVVIPRYQQDMAFDTMMMPTYVHELTHAGQRKRMGAMGYILYKVIKRGKLEQEAIDAESKAQSSFNVNVLTQ